MHSALHGGFVFGLLLRAQEHRRLLSMLPRVATSGVGPFVLCVFGEACLHCALHIVAIALRNTILHQGKPEGALSPFSVG